MYSQDKIDIALQVYHQCGSVTEANPRSESVSDRFFLQAYEREKWKGNPP